MAVHGLPVGEAALQSDRPQAAWEHTEKLSRESGHPYTDRYGQRQNVEAEEVGITGAPKVVPATRRTVRLLD